MTLPASTFEQRAPLYRDLETMLNFGFLSLSLQVGGHSLALRSLNPGDTLLLNLRTQNDHTWMIWALAQSTWMFQGRIIPPERVPDMYDFYLQLPPALLGPIRDSMFRLLQRHQDAFDVIEPYSYELNSRFLWRSSKGNPRIIPPGMYDVGDSGAFRMWAYHNSIEDQKIQLEFDKHHAWMIISPHMSKGERGKLQDRLQRDHHIESGRHQLIWDNFYYKKTLGVEAFSESYLQGKSDFTLKSIEDLEREMYQWVTGEQDWHDQVVSAYKARVLSDFKAFIESEVPLVDTQEGEETPTPLTGYTPDQVRDNYAHEFYRTSSAFADQIGVRLKAASLIERSESSPGLEAQDGRLVPKPLP